MRLMGKETVGIAVKFGNHIAGSPSPIQLCERKTTHESGISMTSIVLITSATNALQHELSSKLDLYTLPVANDAKRPTDS